MATMLVEVGANVELRSIDESGYTAMHVAAQRGHDVVVKMLLESGGADANVRLRADTGATPLFMAVENGHLSVIKVLVEVGRADANLAATSNGCTPLQMAAQKGHLEIIKYLVHVCSADANKANHAGATPLHTAAFHDHLDIVKYLVRVCKVDVNSTNKNGSTPLLVATSNGHTDIVHFLMRNGAQDATCTIPETGQTLNVDDVANQLEDQTISNYVASKRCSVCNKLCKPKLCKGCMQVGYCSSACQKQDWSKHRLVCKKVDQRPIQVGDEVRAGGLVGAKYLNGRLGRVVQGLDEGSGRMGVEFEGGDVKGVKNIKPANLVLAREMKQK